MAVNSNEERQNGHSVTVLSELSITNPQNESKLEFPTLLEVRKVTSPLNNQKLNRTKMEDLEGYIPPPMLDIDIEKGKLESPKSIEGTIRSSKNDAFFSRVLLAIQYIGEKVHDTNTYRARKYKRSASFNSRSVVLLFSVLSIMGTMILIYLTLRVRQLSYA